MTWTLDQRVVAEHVRPFPLVGSDGGMILVFPSEAEALRCEELVPPGMLQAAQPEQRKLRMCGNSKSLCLRVNFRPAENDATGSITFLSTSCAAHERDRKNSERKNAPTREGGQTRAAIPAETSTRDRDHRSAAAAASLPLPSPLASPTDSPRPSQSVPPQSMPQLQQNVSSLWPWMLQGAMTTPLMPTLPMPPQLSQQMSTSTMAWLAQQQQQQSAPPVAPPVAPPLQTVVDFSGGDVVGSKRPRAGEPAGVAMDISSGAVTGTSTSMSSPAASASVHSEGAAAFDAFDDWLAGPHDLKENDDFALSVDRGASASERPGSDRSSSASSAVCASAKDIDSATTYPAANESSAGGAVRAPPKYVDSATTYPPDHGSTAGGAVRGPMDVHGTLFAHGQTLKSCGSSMWTVVSDARLKRVVGDFPLGLDTLMDLRPKVFEYNGLAGTADDGRRFVGLIAQQVPAALVPYCRLEVQVRMRPTDEHTTTVYMLDHSCFPFVAINAMQQQETKLSDALERIQRLEQRAFGTPNEPCARVSAALEEGCASFVAYFGCVGTADDKPSVPTTPSTTTSSQAKLASWLLLAAIAVVSFPVVMHVRSDGSARRVLEMSSYSSIVVAPLVMFLASALVFPQSDNPRELALSTRTRCALTMAAVALFIHRISQWSETLSGYGAQPLSAADVADLAMDIIYNSAVVPALLLQVAVGRIGPWTCLRWNALSIVVVVWAGAAFKWLVTGRYQMYEIIGGQFEMPIMVNSLASVMWIIVAIATLSNVRPVILRHLQEGGRPLSDTLGGDRGSALAPIGLMIPNLAAFGTLAARAFTIEFEDLRGLATSEHGPVVQFNATGWL